MFSFFDLCPESFDKSKERGKSGFGTDSQKSIKDFCSPTERMDSKSKIVCASAVRPDNTGNAYKLNMNNGNMNNNDKTNNNYVRCVRENRNSFSFETLYASYVECRKNKRSTFNALRFEHCLEKNLIELSEKLNNRTYKPQRSVCFTVLKPKPREIFAADFSDRVVQHLLVNYLEEIYEPKFIYDSYACRKNKGTHKAVKRVQSFMRKASKNNTRKAYYLQLDIKSFFMSIDKNVLFNLVSRHIGDEDMRWLAKTIIFHDPTKNYLQKTSKHIREKVPKHKSLLFINKGKGVAIGNYSSQFFANIYLNELDQFVKHELKCRYYARYVDDFVIVSKSREKLLEVREKIKEFIFNKLKLELSCKQKLLFVSNGIDFLGYIIKPHYILVRRRVVYNMKKSIEKHKKNLISSYDEYYHLMYGEKVDNLLFSLNSYLGHLKHANSKKLKNSIMNKYPFLHYYIEIFDLKAKKRFKHNSKTMRGQICFFYDNFSEKLLVFQKGCFYEIFGKDALRFSHCLGLKPVIDSYFRCVVVGFPLISINKYKEKIIDSGNSFVLITQEENNPSMRNICSIYLNKNLKNKNAICI